MGWDLVNQAMKTKIGCQFWQPIFVSLHQVSHFFQLDFNLLYHSNKFVPPEKCHLIVAKTLINLQFELIKQCILFTFSNKPKA